MIINNKENENGQIVENNNDIIQISSNIGEDIYIINIYCSKDKSKIIFKVEQERIQTFYFYEKYDLKDFKQKSKQFMSKENIKEIFVILKQIIEKNTPKLEKNKLKMNFIIFNKSEEILSFSLRKKIVSQKRLNSLLVEQIQNNKSKIKAIKKQYVKYDKSLKNQNGSIDNINNRIDTINNNIENIIEDIKIINCNINNLNEIKEKKILNFENAKNYKNNNENKYKKINKNSNNNSIKDNNMNLNEKTEEKNIFYCYSCKNEIKKLEKRNKFFFFWNTIIIIFIIYLFYNCNKLNNDFIIEKKYSQKLNEKLKHLEDNLSEFNNNNLYNKKNNKLNNICKYIKEKHKNYKNANIKRDDRSENNNLNNIEKFINKEVKDNIIIYNDVDNQIKKEKNKNGKKDNINEIGSNKKDNNQNGKYLLDSEEEINYFKNKIKDKTKYKIKDINFILKYKSDDLEYIDFYNNCKEISQYLILIKNNEGKKVGIIANNIVDILNNIVIINNYSRDIYKNLIGYIFGPDKIDEINFNEIFKVYDVFISIYKDIYHFLINNNHFNQGSTNKLNFEENSNSVGKIDKIEIYQIKFRNN